MYELPKGARSIKVVVYDCSEGLQTPSKKLFEIDWTGPVPSAGDRIELPDESSSVAWAADWYDVRFVRYRMFPDDQLVRLFVQPPFPDLDLRKWAVEAWLKEYPAPGCQKDAQS